MKTIDKLINAKWVVPIAPHNVLLENHSVAIQNGRISALLPTKEAKQQFQAEQVIELDNHVLMPGLINAHTHAPMNLFRGLADDLPLMEWLNDHMWPAEGDVIQSESIIDGTRFAIAEMLRSGTTCFNDMYFFPSEMAKTCMEEGMRACIGHTIMNVPTSFAKDENEYIRKSREVIENTEINDLIRWTIAPHAPYTNSDSSLQKAKALADEFNLYMNIHLHEALDELNMSLKNYQKRPLHRLYDLGILSEKLIAIHMVQLVDSEIALIKEVNASVAHCPESNLKLAVGFCPVQKLLNAGVNVAIGTDGAASNNDLDLFGELRTAALLSKAISEDCTALPAPTALELATINGAKALGLEKEIGSIEAGKYADLIAINFDHLFTQPVYNPISHLAYAVNRLQVSDVWINGDQLLKDGDFTRLDLARTIANANQWAAKAEKYKSKASAVNTATV